jgi:DNA-binding transcriptional LysR family regulator
MIPSPSEIHYFLEVANAQNLSRAAERLGVTQPTLSLAMQKLERSIGSALLIRSKAGIKLTKAGQLFSVQARALLDQWEKIQDGAVRDQTEIRGRFSIGCHPSVAMYALPGFLPALLEKHPDLEIGLHHDLSRKITEAVISSRLDFGLVINPIRHPDLIIQNLGRDEVTFWTAAKCRSPGVLICDPSLAQTQALLLKTRDVPRGRIIETSSLEVACALVAEGLGQAILPTRVAQQNRRFQLKKVAKCPSVYDTIALVSRMDLQKTMAARTIIDAIKKNWDLT